MVILLIFSSSILGTRPRWQICHGGLKRSWWLRLSKAIFFRCGKWTRGYQSKGVHLYDSRWQLLKIRSTLVLAIDRGKTSWLCVKKSHVHNLGGLGHAYIVDFWGLLSFPVFSLFLPLDCMFLRVDDILRLPYFRDEFLPGWQL